MGSARIQRGHDLVALLFTFQLQNNSHAPLALQVHRIYTYSLMPNSGIRRVAPAIGLFFTAPLVSEFLLGDFPIKWIGIVIVLAPLYGGGALLIREVARRTGRGWSTILVLAFAYAIFEEAFTTQTLFNPNYLNLNLHLLDPAYIPALGMGGWWTVFVLTLHTVWSISVSIGLVEALVPDRATAPWLKGIGLTLLGVLFVLAGIWMTLNEIKQHHFIASTTQFAISGIVCLATVIAAFRLPARKTDSMSHGWVPSYWLVGAVALIAGSIFLTVPNRWGWLAVAIYLSMDAALIGAGYVFSRRKDWNASHRLALAGGAALAYAWHAFIQRPVVPATNLNMRVGNAVFAAALILVLVIAGRRISRSVEQNGPAAAA